MGECFVIMDLSTDKYFTGEMFCEIAAFSKDIEEAYGYDNEELYLEDIRKIIETNTSSKPYLTVIKIFH